MMTTTACNDHAGGGRRVRHRVTAVLLSAVALLISLGWAAESWGQTKIARVGILTIGSVVENRTLGSWVEQLRRTLADRGWVEGKNLFFEYRNAGDDPSKFAAAAAALVELKVDVIWASSAPALRAAYAATRTIPIVGGDYTTNPIAEGYIESYARPGGNVTGVFLDAPEFAGKWFEILKAMVPDLSRVTVLWDPSPGAAHLQAVRNVAKLLDIKLQVIEVRKPDDIGTAFDALRGRPQALIILPSPMIYRQSARLATLALKYRLPATSFAREFAEAGGAVAYGPDDDLTTASNSVLVAKILGGSKPAELPVERPTKFKLVVNLKTVKVLGLTVPQSILLRADEVIR